MDIQRAETIEEILAAEHLFDRAIKIDVAKQFLAMPGHHLLLAYADGQPVGMVTGAEIIHPDIGTEMFLNELGVDENYRRQGIGSALVAALADVAQARGCQSMWVGTELDNTAALATYRATKTNTAEEQFVMLSWTFDREPSRALPTD